MPNRIANWLTIAMVMVSMLLFNCECIRYPLSVLCELSAERVADSPRTADAYYVLFPLTVSSSPGSIPLSPNYPDSDRDRG